MEKITVGLLTGGKSRRMGQDKGNLRRGEETFLSYLAETAAGFGPVLVSVDRAEKWKGLPWPLAEDERQEYGPVEGVCQLLRRAETPFLLALAVDLQGVNRDFLRAFLGELRPGDVCLAARSGGTVQPLCCIYSKALLPQLEAMRARGEHRLKALFSEAPVRFVDVEALGFEAEILANLNTPEDYADFLHGQKMQ